MQPCFSKKNYFLKFLFDMKKFLFLQIQNYDNGDKVDFK